MIDNMRLAGVVVRGDSSVDCQSIMPTISMGFEGFTNMLATCRSPCQICDDVIDWSVGSRKLISLR